MASPNGRTEPPSPASVTPPQPALFIGAGELGCRTLEYLPRTIHDLGVQIAGPFGFVAIQHRSPGNAWCAEVHSRNALPSERPPASAVCAEAEGLGRTVRTLARRLAPPPPVRPVNHATAPLAVYLAADLRTQECLAVALEVVRGLREESMPLDVTGVLLTGRSPECHLDENRLVAEGLQCVRNAHEKKWLLHRLFLLDGRDAGNAWLATAEDQAGMAAQFVFHHGLSSYRNALRDHEVQRTFLAQELEDFCGAFSCRTLSSDAETICAGLVNTVVRRLFPDEPLPLSEVVQGEVELAAVRMTDQLCALCDHVGRQRSLEEETGIVLEQTLRSVCVGDRRPRLRSFVKMLERELPRLEIRARIIDRQLDRRRAALALEHAFHPQPRSAVQQSRPVNDESPVAAPGPSLPTLPPSQPSPRLPRATPTTIRLPTPSRVSDCARGLAFLGLGVTFAVVIAARGYEPAWCCAAVLVVASGVRLLSFPRGWTPRTLPDASRTDTQTVAYRRCVSPREIVSGLVQAGVGTLVFTEAAHNLWLYFGAGCLTAAGAALPLGGALRSPWIPADAFDPEQRWPWQRGLFVGVTVGLLAWLAGEGPLGPISDAWRGWIVVLGLIVPAVGWASLAYPATAIFILPPMPSATSVPPPPSHATPEETGGSFSESRTPPPVAPGEERPASPAVPVPAPQPSLLAEPTETVFREVERVVSRLRHWCRRLSVPFSSVLRLPRPQDVDTVLDALEPEWRTRLGERCAADVHPDYAAPEPWLTAVLDEWNHPGPEEQSLEQALARNAIRRWLRTRQWQELIQPDRDWLASYFRSKFVRPWWSTGGGQYQSQSGVVAFDSHLSDLMGSESSLDAPFRLVAVEWSRAGTVVLIRLVQGLPKGSLHAFCEVT